jgi:hypothetical protein
MLLSIQPNLQNRNIFIYDEVVFKVTFRIILVLNLFVSICSKQLILICLLIKKLTIRFLLIYLIWLKVNNWDIQI